MTQENQGTNSAVPDNPPLKRKRGRPRKDRSQTQGQMSATAATDTEKRNQRRRIDSVTETINDMVGQAVFGVLDGSFDAGYLLTVKVGDTDTVLKGVVFQPGSSVPVSGSNDVAPHMKMFRRADIQIPQVDRATHPQGSSGHSVQTSKRPNGSSQRSGDFLSNASQPVNQVPVVPPQPSPSQTHIAEGLQNGTKYIPADEVHTGNINQVIQVTSQEKDFRKSEQNDIFPKDTGALPPAGLNDVDQGLSELNVKPVSAVESSMLEHDECVKKAMLPVTEAPSGSEAPRDQTEQSVKIVPDQHLQVEDKSNETVEAAVECQTTIIDAPHTTTKLTTESENQTTQTDQLHELLPSEAVPAATPNVEAVNSGNVTDLQKDLPEAHLFSSTVPAGNRDLVSEDVAAAHVELQSTSLE
ncbi:At hook motif-containing protein [Thalictrum thalictroides]|uniref:At hook motif-containing protein n=1 Tax=Thalictrum thalictroides TaxID=46969 RepID=A0A7J6V0U6_THATH|nr:At hook motif-containing protein [Thalictrum thalictroides]